MARDYDEKRDFMRMAVECPADITADGVGTVRGTAKNLSSTGLLISCEQALAVGTVIDVRLVPDKPLVPPLQARGKVARVEAAAAGGYEHGVEISEIR